MEFLLPIIILAVVLVVFWLKKRPTKEKILQAKIVAKAAEPHKARGDDDSLPTDYVVTFEAEGKRIPLIVNHSFYDNAVVGTAGKLTHIKDVFVEFEDENPRGYRLQ